MNKTQKNSCGIMPLFTLVALTMLLPMNACHKAEKCTVVCTNGAVNQNCDCDCNCGFGGSSCEVEQTPVKMVVDKIVVNNFPLFDDGKDWDFPLINPQTKYPDLKVKIWKQDGSGDFTITAGTSDVHNNTLVPNVPYTFDFSVTLANPTDSYRVSLYDYDSASDPGGVQDQFMGGVNFKPYKKGEKFPAKIELTANGGLLVMDVYVKYHFSDGCVR